MKALFLSDVHLKDCDSPRSQKVLNFLREASGRYDRIYILGDFFDVWPGTNRYLLDRFAPVLKQLRTLIQEGHQLLYVEGNHDFLLGDHFREMGIEIIPNEKVEVFNGRRVYIAHGDLGNPEERGYRILRKLLRSTPLHLLMKFVPGKWIFDVGAKSSDASRGYQRRFPEKEERIRTVYRETSKRLFQQGFDVVLMGHTHLPDDFRFSVDGRECRYINTGDWVRSFTYLEFDGQDFYTKSCADHS
jgi:UDP-2,3-diacylglucosamine hydrolase